MKDIDMTVSQHQFHIIGMAVRTMRDNCNDILEGMKSVLAPAQIPDNVTPLRPVESPPVNSSNPLPSGLGETSGL
jgi:hypothetical protein